MKLALVGDIGGTNARFALWRDDHLEAVQVLATADFPGPEQAILAYLQAQGLPLGAIGSVCLACAGPVSGDLFRFTNNHWRIDRAAFCEALQVDELLMINDFSAMALGMTRLAEHERVPVCEGQAQAERPVLVIGAGTGLGVGTLLEQADGRWLVLPGRVGMSTCPSAVRAKPSCGRFFIGNWATCAPKTCSVAMVCWCCIGPSVSWTVSRRSTTRQRPSLAQAWRASPSPLRCWNSSVAGSAALLATMS